MQARLQAIERISGRRWNLILDDGVTVKLPETGWKTQIDALEHLIVDKGILERDVEEIDLRSPDNYFFVLRGEKKPHRVTPGERGLMGETIRMRTATAQPAQYRTGLVAALDIGSSKVACLIGRAEPGNPARAGCGLARIPGHQIGHGHQPRPRRGIDPRSRGRGREPCRHAHPERAGLGGLRHADARSPRARPPRSTARWFPTAICARFWPKAAPKCRLDGHEVIQAAPTSYVVDEARGVRDPRGMFCQRIGVTMHAVAVKPSPLQNLKLAVERCHLTVAGSLFSPYASALSTLSEDEKQLGATVIDMGGGVTSVAVFLEGQLVYADVVPVGGSHVTSDLARMLSAPLSAAERIKTLYGAALGDIETGTDAVAVPQMGEDGEDNVIARAALDADAHHPGAARGDFRRGPEPAARRPASTSPPAAARC